MNLSQYIVAVLVVQTVRCNTIGGIHSPRFSDQEKNNKNSEIGIQTIGDNSDFASKQNGLITYDLTHHPSNDIMTSSELLHMIMTSSDLTPSSSSSSLVRVKRGSSSKSPRRKKCDPADKECKKNRRKGSRKRGGKKEKGKKGRRKKKCKRGKKGKRRCGKGKGNSPKPPPINGKTNLTYIQSTPGAELRQVCIRTVDCPEGYCCARHHWEKVCKPYVKVDEVCTRPRRKNRRSMEHYQRCPCEEHLVCRREPAEAEGKKNQLFKCHAKT